jgi:hypothetical protein
MPVSWCRSAKSPRERRARLNQDPKRVEQRNDDKHDESSLFGTASNLNRRNAYAVFDSHSHPEEAHFEIAASSIPPWGGRCDSSARLGV